MKKLLLFLICVLLMISSAAIGSTGIQSASDEKSMEIQDAYLDDSTTAIISTKFGEIKIAFYTGVAPETVENFITLAEAGFYNGITFHRIIPNFIIQGGDPNTLDNDRSNDGTGGPGYTIPLEVHPNVHHERGSVAMAKRAGANYSSGSQFYICLAPCPYLDGDYTIFAKVISGMDVVDNIVVQPRDQADNPIERIPMEVKVER